MKNRSQIERNMFGDFGIGAEEISRTIRNEVTAWKRAEKNPDLLVIRLEALRILAASLGDQLAALNLAFNHFVFLRMCGFEDNT